MPIYLPEGVDAPPILRERAEKLDGYMRAEYPRAWVALKDSCALERDRLAQFLRSVNILDSKKEFAVIPWVGIAIETDPHTWMNALERGVSCMRFICLRFRYGRMRCEYAIGLPVFSACERGIANNVYMRNVVEGVSVKFLREIQGATA